MASNVAWSTGFDRSTPVIRAPSAAPLGVTVIMGFLDRLFVDKLRLCLSWMQCYCGDGDQRSQRHSAPPMIDSIDARSSQGMCAVHCSTLSR